jgi:lysophospholipase L1-like esterase
MAPPPSAQPLSALAVQSPREAYVVAATGDSLTDARSRGGRFLDVLRKRCPGSRFDNYGKGGEMVSQMRKRFDADMFAAGKPHYTHIIVFGGVNDLYSDLTAGRTPVKIAADLAWMYREAHDHGARVIALTVAPWGGFKRFFNEGRSNATLVLNRWILAQEGATLVDAAVDTYGMLSCGDATRLCPAYMPPFADGLHFGDEGHGKLGEALFARVFANCA